MIIHYILLKGGQHTALEAVNLIIPGLGVILDIANTLKSSDEFRALMNEVLLEE